MDRCRLNSCLYKFVFNLNWIHMYCRFTESIRVFFRRKITVERVRKTLADPEGACWGDLASFVLTCNFLESSCVGSWHSPLKILDPPVENKNRPSWRSFSSICRQQTYLLPFQHRFLFYRFFALCGNQLLDFEGRNHLMALIITKSNHLNFPGSLWDDR